MLVGATYLASSVASNARASRMPTLSPSGWRNAIAFSMCFRASPTSGRGGGLRREATSVVPSGLLRPL